MTPTRLDATSALVYPNQINIDGLAVGSIMDGRAQRFVLFAHPRSGSSSLLETLQRHPGIQMADEPFNERYHSFYCQDPNYVDYVFDTYSLDQQLSLIYAKYDGLKLLDYQLTQELCAHLLLRPDLKVINLKRRNLLQTIVSDFIALQSGIWNVWELKNASLEEAYSELKAVSIDKVKESLEHAKNRRRTFAEILAQKPPHLVFDLEYEDVYTPSAEENRRRLSGVFRFLGLNPNHLGDATYYLDPSQTKMNNEQSYRRLPNAQLINDHLGCDETGWLFDEG